METKYIKLSVVTLLALALSACVVAPAGYRVSNRTVPTYDYYGGPYGDTVVQTSPVYNSNTYYPYYAPTYVDPFYGVGVGVGIGIGVNCCWGGRGGYRSGYRRGWRR
jgi:hypothetical protein